MVRKKLPADPAAITDDELPVPAKRGSKHKHKEETGTYESPGFWVSEIAAAKKRDDKFRERGKKIRELYSGETSESTPFNILFSNTEIILPSVYSQVPRPVVQRRFKDDNPVGEAAAKAAQSCLEFLLDTNVDGYETFDEGMKSATLDGLLPGRGVSSAKYDAEVVGEESVSSELICLNSRSWDRVLFGYAKKWSKMPWVAYEETVDEEEATRLVGKEGAALLEYSVAGKKDSDGKKDDKDTGERKVATIYQIWDKIGGRKIRYLSLSNSDEFLKVSEDPLDLTGFFDTPKPLMFVDKTNDMSPTALYTLYENQASELNRIQRRINKMIDACKARGLYDSALGDDLKNLMDADENELIPADKSSSLAAEKGLDNAIWFMPLDVIIKTLTELYKARESCKQVIYEIMGISDIVRGASKASETLGAQELKSQWGTLRLKNKQKEVQRYARDLLRMMLEIAASKFNENTWAKMTGLPYLTQPQFAQLQQQFQAMQSQAQVVAAQAQQSGQQIPPQVQQQAMQQMQQMQQKLQTPQWSQILQVLNDDMQRAYRIDIETNSTIEPEAAEDQKQIADLMNAIGQFLTGVGPMVQQGIMPFEVAKTMLTAITRRFKFGRDIEDQIAQMQAPKPEGDDGAAQKAQAQAAEQKIQAAQKETQQAAKIAQLETQLKAKDTELAQLKKASELDNRERVLTDAEARFKLEQKAANESIANKSAVEHTKLDSKKQVMGVEEKRTAEKQNVAKTVDSKLAGSVEKMGEMVNQLVTMQGGMLKAVGELAQGMQATMKAASAPRRRKAIRDKAGVLVGTEDEPVAA